MRAITLFEAYVKAARKVPYLIERGESVWLSPDLTIENRKQYYRVQRQLRALEAAIRERLKEQEELKKALRGTTLRFEAALECHPDWAETEDWECLDNAMDILKSLGELKMRESSHEAH